MQEPNQSGIPTPRLALIVLVVMAALYAVDKFLARQEQNELLQQAHSYYVDGQKSMRDGNPHLAIRQFQSAHVLERSNEEYLRSLAAAQLADGDGEKSRDTLDEILRKNSNDAQANLLMARAMEHDGRFEEADAYYHRSIYGTWPAKSNSGAAVRLELAGILAQRGQRQELLSELLLLENQGGLDLATEKTIADLFLKAGSAQRAVGAFRTLAKKYPDDPQILTSLGRAYTALGDYGAARATFEKAWSRNRENKETRSDLEMVARLAELDPTLRRLPSSEKFRRSSEILAMTESEIHGCLGSRLPSEELKPLLLLAQTLNAEKIKTSPSNETAESRLELAEKLWADRAEACNTSIAPDDPLGLLMRKLTQ
jgi:tetratricopeptide (TPR) repeat protein